MNEHVEHIQKKPLGQIFNILVGRWYDDIWGWFDSCLFCVEFAILRTCHIFATQKNLMIHVSKKFQKIAPRLSNIANTTRQNGGRLLLNLTHLLPSPFFRQETRPGSTFVGSAKPNVLRRGGGGVLSIIPGHPGTSETQRYLGSITILRWLDP